MRLPFAEWLPQQRWYAGRDRSLVGVRTERVTPLFDCVEHHLLGVAYADGGSDRYQVLVRWDDMDTRVPARIGRDGGRVGYDALYDGAAARGLLALIDAGAQLGELRFIREPQARLPLRSVARVGSAEQSNTSVVFDSAALLKVFRRVPAGVNPDVELGRVLGRAGCPNVATLLGAIEGTAGGEPATLAMVSEYARDCTEGWAMASASARGRLAHRGPTSGEDFSAESFRLGGAVAEVHRVLACELGSAAGPLPIDGMLARLDAAVAAVPELVRYAPKVREAYEAAAGAGVILQRVHGDLHLGQVLRTPATWLLIDFEGEPGQPIEARRQPDSALRDIAGMLRSFEYAAYQLIADGPTEQPLEALAREWIDRNRTAFCAGYAAAGDLDPAEHGAVLTAYELDKMVYEVGYEARHRPGWLAIPRRSMQRLLG